MKPDEAINNIECRFLNDVERQLLHEEEWVAIKAYIQQLRLIADSVKMGVGK